jgi:hypothetical protein
MLCDTYTEACLAGQIDAEARPEATPELFRLGHERRPSSPGSLAPHGSRRPSTTNTPRTLLLMWPDALAGWRLSPRGRRACVVHHAVGSLPQRLHHARARPRDARRQVHVAGRHPGKARRRHHAGRGGRERDAHADADVLCRRDGRPRGRCVGRCVLFGGRVD